MLLDVFLKGDVYIDYPFEDVKFRYEKQTGKVYCRFYGRTENEVEPSSNLYHEAISTGKQIARDEYFRDFIGNALAKLKRLNWQDAEQRAQKLKASPRAQQALDAVAAGTSAVTAGVRDRLRDGLDQLCIDTGWTGLMVAWLDCLLSGKGAALTNSAFSADQLVDHYLQDCLPLSNLVSGCPILDASDATVPPSLPLAMIRQDATLVLARGYHPHEIWLRACAEDLGLENLVVTGQVAEERLDATLFLEILSRDGAPVRAVLERTQHMMALGGRWYILRAQIDATESDGLPEFAEFVQAIALPAPGLDAPRQILHIATGVSPMSVVPVPAEPRQAAPAARENPVHAPEPNPASLTVERSACELYETDSENVVAFLGSWGSEGLLNFHERSGWTFHPAGSIAWDSFHQGVYRNHKAHRLTSVDLERRGIPAPPADRYGRTPAVDWKDNFNAELPLSAVPPGILDRLRENGSRQSSVYLVLYEDVYETAFGDGCFWYLQGAFWTENEARIFLRLRLAQEAERPKNELGCKYRLKEIRLSADETEQKLAAALEIEKYEHYSVEDVVRLLAREPENRD